MPNGNKVYQILASAVDARRNCLASEEQTGRKHDWTDSWQARIGQIVADFMPSGSGIDCGTKIDLEASTGEKLVFDLSYHHMNDGGYYDGWTEHRLTVKGSLQFGYTMSFSGRNRNDIKEYLHQTYSEALSLDLEWDQEGKRYFSPQLREAHRRYQEQLKANEPEAYAKMLELTKPNE